MNFSRSLFGRGIFYPSSFELNVGSDPFCCFEQIDPELGAYQQFHGEVENFCKTGGEASGVTPGSPLPSAAEDVLKACWEVVNYFVNLPIEEALLRSSDVRNASLVLSVSPTTTASSRFPIGLGKFYSMP